MDLGSKFFSSVEVAREVCLAYWRSALRDGGMLDRRADRFEKALQLSSPGSAWFTRAGVKRRVVQEFRS